LLLRHPARQQTGPYVICGSAHKGPDREAEPEKRRMG